MPPKISTIIFKAYTPTKRKFKPLRDENATSNAFDNNEVYSEWSGIDSENDSEWPPLSLSSSAKPLVTHVWPKSPSLSFTNEDHEITNQKKYAFIITN